MLTALRAFFACLLLGLCLAAGMVHAEVAVPPLQARVTDLSGTLDAAQQSRLEQELAAFEARKGSQIAVLIVPSTQPESIEQYAIRVAEAWKLGRKGIDDGALLLVAKNDRALRIEVGYGLEGVVPDAVAKRVISEIIVPYFKQGDFYGGVHAGVARLIRLVEGEPLPPPQKDVSWSGVEDFLPLAFILVFVVGGVLRAVLGRFLGATVAGGVTGLVAWLILGSLLAAAVVGVVAFAFTLGGGRGPGRFGGWSSGSGGMGGGGFSGGGGGFGGGGASGRW